MLALTPFDMDPTFSSGWPRPRAGRHSVRVRFALDGTTIDTNVPAETRGADAGRGLGIALRSGTGKRAGVRC